MCKRKQKRDRLDFVLGFIAAAAMVGAPIALLFSWTCWMVAGIMLGAGVLGGIYGDRFFHAVAESALWNGIIGYWRRPW